MAYNKTEILALPDEEKLALASVFWSSVEEKLLPITADDIAFVEERLKLHEANPTEGMAWDVVREKIKAKYGF
jgi:putative addiction module component (TIGR02574 family)